ncbi:MAG: glycosyltransferase family 4 protein [Candidatus Schekmanbacteria bacterium]|nr:glycosyltransferase family 4 protein [Candidatus Schekmanbacteria bacterium]
MKVAYITSMKKGLPSFIYREIEMLYDQGMEVEIFSLKFSQGLYMPKKDWKYYHFNPLKIILLQPLYLLKNPFTYLAGLLEALQTNSIIDFIIANFYAPIMKEQGIARLHCQEGLHAVFIGYYCKKFLNIPLSLMVHADALYINPNPKFAKIAFAACDDVLTVSHYNREKIIKDFGLPKERVSVLRLGVEPQKFTPTERRKIMIVGQYAARKGHDTLLKAIKELKRDDIEIWIVGAGSWGKADFVDVEGLVKEFGLYDKTVFFRGISEYLLCMLYQNCDIFCLPSRVSKDGNCEGIPVSLMEAMAAGKPVVSTWHTGIPELVQHGLLIQENDYQGLSKALAKLLDDDALRAQLGEKNRQTIRKEFSLVDNVNKLAKYFKEGTCA